MRARLLKAAGRLLADEGADALSMRRLADEVGTTTRAVYSVFGGKDGLVSAMYLEMADALGEQHLAVPVSDDPVEELLLLGQAYRASALAHPNLYPLVFGRPVPGFTPQPDAVAYARRGFARVIDTFERGITSGVFVGRDSQAMAHEIWALVHGLASLELGGALGTPRHADALWHDAVSAMASAFTRPPLPQRPAKRRR